VIVASTAAAMALGVVLNSRNYCPSVAKHYRSQSYGFNVTQFVHLSGFSAELVGHMQKDLCDGIGRGLSAAGGSLCVPGAKESRVPEPLQPETVRPLFPAFYISDTVPITIDEYHPVAQSLLEVASIEKSAEYVIYFSIVLAGLNRQQAACPYRRQVR
jgi:hypothetical protein